MRSIAREADLFYADLLGVRRRRAPAPLPAPTPAARPPRPEPGSWARPDLVFDNFIHHSPQHGEAIGEAFDEGWTVAASPFSDTPLSSLRPSDVVLQRAMGDGRLAFVHVLSDIDGNSLYGPGGVIRADTLVLRKADDTRVEIDPPSVDAPSVDSPSVDFDDPHIDFSDTSEDQPPAQTDTGETIVHLPLLTAHAASGFSYNLSGPNCVLRWHRVPRGFSGAIDVVVHFHGYKGHNAMRLADKANASGLDLQTPGVAAPTLGLVPHGKAFASRIPGVDGFTFPAIASRDALQRFIDAGIAALKTAIASAEGQITVRRVILTGHSGGGAALNVLMGSMPAGDGAHVFHYFDATYGGAPVLTNASGWLRKAIERDARVLKDAAEADRARLMNERGGGLRIVFIDNSPTAPTARAVDQFIDRTLREVVPDQGARSFLRRYYRAQTVANPKTVGHSRVPSVFGGRLLADGGHALDPDGRDLIAARAPTEDSPTPATPTPTPAPTSAPTATPTAGAPLDRVRAVIETTLNSFRSVLIALPAPVGREVAVRVPYFINKPTSPSRLRGEQRRPALMRNAVLSRLYNALHFRARVGKSYPADVRTFLQGAVDGNAVPGQSSGLSANGLTSFLSDMGVGVDCSGFVSQALNACLAAFGRSESIDTNAANLRGGPGHNQRQFDIVSRPSDLMPGDTMWKTGHIRIIHNVEPQADGSIQFMTAESSSIDLVGPIAKTWKCPHADRFVAIQLERGGSFQASTEVNVFSRYKPLADALRGGATTGPAPGAPPAPPTREDVAVAEDLPSVVGSPRRTAAEWHKAAKAGFLGKLPERTRSATGSEVMTPLLLPASEPKHWAKNAAAKLARDEKIREAIVGGNIPRFLRQGTVVTVTFTGKDKKEHTIHYQVMREYLTVGNTRDHVVVPLIPATAQKIADAFGCILPTRKMVDQIFEAAGVKLNALPRDYWMQGQTDSTGKKVPVYDPTKDTKLVTHEYDEHLKKSDCQISTASYLEHNLAIKKQLKDEESLVRGNDMPLIAGHKKDLVIAKNARTDKLQAYGWFKVTKKPDGTKVGTPIQNFVETAHEPQYVDYSHAARLVAGTMLVDGTEMTAAEVLAHDVYSWGINTDGPITSPRVPNVPVP